MSVYYVGSYLQINSSNQVSLGKTFARMNLGKEVSGVHQTWNKSIIAIKAMYPFFIIHFIPEHLNMNIQMFSMDDRSFSMPNFF